MRRKRALTAIGLGVAAGAAVARASRRRAAPGDPAHAPGHRHLAPPPDAGAPTPAAGPSPHDQPWVRTTHSDSQRRRFRR